MARDGLSYRQDFALDCVHHEGKVPIQSYFHGPGVNRSGSSFLVTVRTTVLH
jgi:hypothetical protein